jgi:glycosyltransferase involved in cell wall biosynthesis
MYKGKKVIVVMPAYNAEKTLEITHGEVLSHGIVDEVIVVDDLSKDNTAAIAAALPQTTVIRHQINLGYGGNQKTCYEQALMRRADIVVMVHPDYQYTPKLIPAMVSMIGDGLFECVLASRILGGGALAGGMPWWRYAANRMLTFAQNILCGAKLSEYHTGYRAYSRRILEKIPFKQNSNDFVFDNQILMQILWMGAVIAEVTCPTKYFAEGSSISFRRSIVYGSGCMIEAVKYRLAKMGMLRNPLE